MINGKARHSQSQGSVERCNRDIENMLACWQRDNKSTNWSYGLQFVQYAKNARHHTGIGRSPFMALMGYDAKLGVQTLNLDKEILEGVEDEEQLESLLSGSVGNLDESFNNNDDDGRSGAAENMSAPTEVQDPASDEIIIAASEPVVPNMEISLSDINEDEIVMELCFSCQGDFDEVTFHDSKSCASCGKFCHNSCLTENDCRLCHMEKNIVRQRQGAKRKQQDQADKMLERSTKRFKEAEINGTVLVPIPDVDRGRCDYPNLKAIVLEQHPNGHLWKLGCESGVLDQWYSRNQFQPTTTKFMTVSEVPLEKEISLRAAAKAESISGGQGFSRCQCTGNCKTKRCKCFKSNVKCNSKCHNQRSCTNKD